MAFLSVLLCAASTLAQTNAPQGRSMSLDECVAITLEHNFGVQISRYSALIARYTLAGSYGAYDPTFTFSGEHQYSLSPGGIDSQGRVFGGTETDADAFRSGLQGLLPWGLNYNLGGNMTDRTGTRPSVVIDPTNPIGVTTNHFFDPVANAPVTLLSTNFGTINRRTPFETTDGSVAAISLTQPLLRDFWIDQTRFTIYSNKKNVTSRDADFRDEIMTAITDVENAYYALVSAEDSVKVQEKALELAERLLAENKKRVEVGALAPLDEQQAQSQAATSRAALLQAQSDRDTAERALKSLLSDSYTNQWAEVRILPTDRLVAVPQIYDLQESWRRGLAEAPGLLQARSGLDVQKYNLRFRRNQLLPSVDVIGSYGYNASSKEFSGAFGQIGDQSFPTWSVGGQLSVPLSRVSERNSYKSAKASKEQQELSVKQLEQNTLITIENDIGTAKAKYEQVEATHQARLYAEAALEAEQKKLENGKSTTFVVLQLQRDLTQARANEINALADYNRALAELALAEGATLERRKIALDVQRLHAGPAPVYQPVK